jgi:hypothetical protein
MEEDEGLSRRFRANGGRIGFRGGAAAASDAAAGRDAGRDTSAAGTSDRGDGPATGGGPTGNVGGGVTNIPSKKNIPTPNTDFTRFNKDLINLGFIDPEDKNITVADATTIPTEGKFGLNLIDYSTLKNTGYTDTQIGELQNNPNINTQEVIRDIKGTGFATGGRIGLMEGGMPYEGGIMDLESARQMYGLGKLVKKVTRTVKKIAKSPIGKAALLYAGGTYLGGSTALGGAGGSFMSRLATPSNLMNLGNIFSTQGISSLKGSLFGQAGSRVGQPFVPFKEGLLTKLGLTKGGGSLMPTALGGIAAVSALAGSLTAEQEEEAQLISDQTGIDIAEIRANPNKYLGRRFRAEGGSMDEPVAKKTMPLLDMGGKEMDLRAEGGFVPIGRMEKADDVPARLSKNEFVFTAEAVRNAGEGDVDKGAEVMYNMMKNLESGGEVSEESQGLEGARKMFQTSQRLEEVL